MTPHDILRKTFGYETFRPGQEGIVTTLLEGRNVLAVMPTGSGKSLCYQVPALARGGLAIVVSPLVALMQDQVAALKLAGVAAETINSAASREENVVIWRKVASGEVRLLYLSPERLMTERMIAALSRLEVTLIAIDEAHCISQWGASFRPEYDMLQTLRQSFPGVPIGAFTATADEATRRDIVGKIFGGEAEVYVAGFDRPNINLAVAPKDNAKQQLLDFLDGRAGQSGIVYALSRKSTEELAAFLVSKGRRAIAYHAGMSAEDRAEAQNLFMTEKGIIVCATIAFGMASTSRMCGLSSMPTCRPRLMLTTRRSAGRAAMAARRRPAWSMASPTSRCAAASSTRRRAAMSAGGVSTSASTRWWLIVRRPSAAARTCSIISVRSQSPAATVMSALTLSTSSMARRRPSG